MVEENKTEESTGQEAKFNFALSSLERIHKLLMKISQVEADTNISSEGKQVVKRRLVRQLFVQAYVLLKDEDKSEIKKKVNALKLYFNKNKLLDYSEKLEEEMNDCLILIQESMQKHGKYFVLKKEDSDLF